MKTIVELALCMLVAHASTDLRLIVPTLKKELDDYEKTRAGCTKAQLYNRRGIGGLGGIDGIGGIGGIVAMDGIGGIGGPIVDNWGVGGGIGILSTYCPSSYCFNGQCNRLVRHASYLGRRCYCSCGGY